MGNMLDLQVLKFSIFATVNQQLNQPSENKILVELIVRLFILVVFKPVKL